jgi:general nucleoside transport system permease protein
MQPFDSAWLIAAIGLSVPMLWASLGELISERAGVLNIGLEGMILGGAFASFAVAGPTGSPWLGVLAAVGVGVLLAAVMAFFTIDAAADQIVVGLGLYILAGGATAFANQKLFSGSTQVTTPTLSIIDVPGLVHLPVIGRALFHQTLLGYGAFLAVPVTYVLLWRTNWGLAVRAVGEAPEAGEAGGVAVRQVRWTATLCAGVGGGLSGAVLTTGTIGVFGDNMSSGRGFIALAAVVFGRWRPAGVLVACLVFGAADALQLRLQAIGDVPRAVWIAAAAIAALALAARVRSVQRPGRQGIALGGAFIAGGVALAVADPTWHLPAQLWLTLPYVLTLIVLAGSFGKSRMPSALGVPVRGTGAGA